MGGGGGAHHQKIWNLLVFPSGRLRLLRVRLLFFILRSLCSSVSRPSRVRNLVNTSTRSLGRFHTLSCCLLTWTHSDMLHTCYQEAAGEDPETLTLTFVLRMISGDYPEFSAVRTTAEDTGAKASLRQRLKRGAAAKDSADNMSPLNTKYTNTK